MSSGFHVFREKISFISTGKWKLKPLFFHMRFQTQQTFTRTQHTNNKYRTNKEQKNLRQMNAGLHILCLRQVVLDADKTHPSL